MALSYESNLKTSQGDEISISATDGEIMKLAIAGGSSIALALIDVNNLVTFLMAISSAKSADARIKRNEKKS